jgi:L-fucose isomerase-like protein
MVAAAGAGGSFPLANGSDLLRIGDKMAVLRKLKIGLAGVMCTPFRGDKERYFAEDWKALSGLQETAGFELKVIEKGIYTLEEAQQAADALSQWGADFILLQSSSFAAAEFIRPFAASRLRLGLWGVPEGEPSAEGGLPLNSFTGVNLYNSLLKTRLKEYPHPVKWFFGHSENPSFKERFEITVQALRALVNLRGSRVGLAGGVAPGFDNLTVDPAVLKNKLGVEVVELDFDAVLKRAQTLEDQKLIDAVKKSFLQPNVNFNAHLGGQLEKLSRLQIAYSQFAQEEGLSAFAISCWPRFQSDYGVAVCSLLGQLNTLGIPAACEGDVPAAVSMLALSLLSNGAVTTLMDLVTLDGEDDSVLLWHCGPTSPLLADERGVRMNSLWLFDQPAAQPVGLHNDLILKGGKVTVAGFTADFERALVLEGEIDPHKPSYKGSSGWLKQIHMRGKRLRALDLAETLLSSGFQHHYPLAYGRLENAFLEMAAWADIAEISPCSYTTYLKPQGTIC